MSKYPDAFYKTVVGYLCSYAEENPDAVEQFIDFCPNADKDAIRDLMNLY
jgi:hypothetical protein